MRKTVFGVSDQVRHKPGCAATEDGKRLEISDLRSRDCTIRVAKSKVLISFAVTAIDCKADLCFLFSHVQKSGFLMLRHYFQLRFSFPPGSACECKLMKNCLIYSLKCLKNRQMLRNYIILTSHFY